MDTDEYYKFNRRPIIVKKKCNVKPLEIFNSIMFLIIAIVVILLYAQLNPVISKLNLVINSAEHSIDTFNDNLNIYDNLLKNSVVNFDKLMNNAEISLDNFNKNSYVIFNNLNHTIVDLENTLQQLNKILPR
jgi:hypothetical protein